MEKSEDHNNDEIENNGKPRLKGICLAFLSATLLLAQNTILQKIKVHFNDALLVRALLQLGLGLILVGIRGEHIWINEVDFNKNIHKMRAMLFAYGILAALFNASDLVAVYLMPLGDAMTIIMSSVLPTTLLAAIILKEKLRLYKAFCIVLVIVGLVLVIRPPFLFGNSCLRSKDYLH